MHAYLYPLLPPPFNLPSPNPISTRIYVQSCQRTADLVQQAEDLGEDSGTLSGVDNIIVERSGLEEGGRRGGEGGGGSEGVGYATENGRLCEHHLLKDSALLQLQKRVGPGCMQRRGSDIKQNGGGTTHCQRTISHRSLTHTLHRPFCSP